MTTMQSACGATTSTQAPCSRRCGPRSRVSSPSVPGTGDPPDTWTRDPPCLNHTPTRSPRGAPPWLRACARFASRVEELPLDAAAEVLVLLEWAVAAFEQHPALALERALTGAQ
jgi:hypothetical protein